MKYDYETAEMIIQDFCNRQQNLISSEIFNYIDKILADVSNITQGSPDLFECDKENFDNLINNFLDSSRYRRYVRIPKSLQDYLDVKVMIDRKVSEQIQKAKYDVNMDFINNLHKVNRGLRRYSGVQEQRMNGEYM